MSKIRLSYKKIIDLLAKKNLLIETIGDANLDNFQFDFYINSKEDRSDDCFIAFKGASFDRHEVISELSQKGTRLFIADDKSKLSKLDGSVILLVADSRKLGHILKRRLFLILKMILNFLV